jgi:hypothetical protein
MARPNQCCTSSPDSEFHATFSSGFWYGLHAGSGAPRAFRAGPSEPAGPAAAASESECLHSECSQLYALAPAAQVRAMALSATAAAPAAEPCLLLGLKLFRAACAAGPAAAVAPPDSSSVPGRAARFAGLHRPQPGNLWTVHRDGRSRRGRPGPPGPGCRRTAPVPHCVPQRQAATLRLLAHTPVTRTPRRRPRWQPLPTWQRARSDTLAVRPRPGPAARRRPPPGH